MAEIDKTLYGYDIDAAELALGRSNPNGFFGHYLFAKVLEAARFFRDINTTDDSLDVTRKTELQEAEIANLNAKLTAGEERLQTIIEDKDEEITDLKTKLAETEAMLQKRTTLLAGLVTAGKKLDDEIQDVTVDGLAAPWTDVLEAFENNLSNAEDAVSDSA